VATRLDLANGHDELGGSYCGAELLLGVLIGIGFSTNPLIIVFSAILLIGVTAYETLALSRGEICGCAGGKVRKAGALGEVPKLWARNAPLLIAASFGSVFGPSMRALTSDFRGLVPILAVLPLGSLGLITLWRLLLVVLLKETPAGRAALYRRIALYARIPFSC
jgi:hypothetical protein